MFQFNTLTNALARCPHCRKVSSVGDDYSRTRCYVYLFLGIAMLLVAIGVTYFTSSYAQTHNFAYVGYVTLFGIAVILLARMIYYATLKVSEIEGNYMPYGAHMFFRILGLWSSHEPLTTWMYQKIQQINSRSRYSTIIRANITNCFSLHRSYVIHTLCHQKKQEEKIRINDHNFFLFYIFFVEIKLIFLLSRVTNHLLVLERKMCTNNNKIYTNTWGDICPTEYFFYIWIY